MEDLINDTSEIKSQGEIRKLNPNMSLPRVWDANVCEVLGITPVLAAPKPEPSGEFKSVVRNGVTTDALGNTVQAWTERDMFSDYTDEDGTVHTKAEQEQAYTAKKLEQLKQSIESAAQRNLDSAAKERGYDDAERCISYITSTNPTWKADADAMNTHRDAVWSKLFEIMGQVESGGRAAPTGFDEIEPELPVIDWTLA
jgi:hypothetical protein